MDYWKWLNREMFCTPLHTEWLRMLLLHIKLGMLFRQLRL